MVWQPVVQHAQPSHPSPARQLIAEPNVDRTAKIHPRNRTVWGHATRRQQSHSEWKGGGDEERDKGAGDKGVTNGTQFTEATRNNERQQKQTPTYVALPTTVKETCHRMGVSSSAVQWMAATSDTRMSSTGVAPGATPGAANAGDCGWCTRRGAICSTSSPGDSSFRDSGVHAVAVAGSAQWCTNTVHGFTMPPMTARRRARVGRVMEFTFRTARASVPPTSTAPGKTAAAAGIRGVTGDAGRGGEGGAIDLAAVAPAVAAPAGGVDTDAGDCSSARRAPAVARAMCGVVAGPAGSAAAPGVERVGRADPERARWEATAAVVVSPARPARRQLWRVWEPPSRCRSGVSVSPSS